MRGGLTRIDPSAAAAHRRAAAVAVGRGAVAATGAIWIGLAIVAGTNVARQLDVTLGVMAVVLAAFALQLEPRAALLTLSLAFIVHALVDIAHRPGMLAPTIAPRWFIVGCAVYDVYLAAICYWARRR